MTTTRPSFASIREPLWQNLLERGGLSSSPWSGTRIEARHAGWLLVLDSYRVPVESFDHTRMTVALPSLGFRFRVHEPDAFSWIGTIFGLLDIEIGEELFDQNWLIRSNSPTKIRELLSDPSLRDQIDVADVDKINVADCARSRSSHDHNRRRAGEVLRKRPALISTSRLIRPASYACRINRIGGKVANSLDARN